MTSAYLLTEIRTPEDVAEARLMRRHEQAKPWAECDTCRGTGFREDSRGREYECDHCDGRGGEEVSYQDWIETLPSDDTDIVILYGRVPVVGSVS